MLLNLWEILQGAEKVLLAAPAYAGLYTDRMSSTTASKTIGTSLES